LLDLQLKSLQSDAKRLPELREEVYAARDDLPPVLDVSDLRADLNTTFADNGLVLLQGTVGDSMLLEPTVMLTDAAAAVGLPSPTDGLQFTGLVATPVELRTAGSLTKIESLLHDLQRGNHRYLLVSRVGFTPV